MHEDLKPVDLRDLMPEALKPRLDLEKHKLRTCPDLIEFFERMILEHKSSKAMKRPRIEGVHELQQSPPEPLGTGSRDESEGNFWYGLLLYAKESDVEKALGPEELLTFQRWKAKGGGKGGPAGNRWPQRFGKGGGNVSAGTASTSGTSATSGNSEVFEGECSHCSGKGHRKRDCPVLDNIMAERKAQGLSPPRGEGKGQGGWQGNNGGGSGKGWGGGKGQGIWNGGKGNGKGKGAFQLDHPQIDWPAAVPGVQDQGQQGVPAMTMAQQWAASGPGWGGRLCNVMERVDPRSLPRAPAVEKPKSSANKNP